MHKRVTFRDMNHSEPMEAHVNKQLEKVQHFLMNERTPIHIDMVLTASRLHAHPRAELRIKTPHFDLVTHYEKEGIDLYEAIDHTIDKMYKLLHEEKKRYDEKMRARGRHEDIKRNK
jgi:ribosomal subunit interface protein